MDEKAVLEANWRYHWSRCRWILLYFLWLFNTCIIDFLQKKRWM